MGIFEIEGAAPPNHNSNRAGGSATYHTFQVQEQDKESSSSSSEFIDLAGLDKLSSKIGGGSHQQEDAENNSDELDKNWKLAINDSAGRHLKKSSDYMKIVEN